MRLADRRAQRGALSESALRVCRALLALLSLTAIGYDVAAGPGVSDGDYFSYFTVLSNLFATAMLLYGALRPAHARSRTVELLRGAAVVYILTTGIVYLVLLSGKAPVYPWVNAILHYLMPLAVTLDWLLDPPRAHDRISGGGLVGVLNLVAWLMRQRSLSAIGC